MFPSGALTLFLKTIMKTNLYSCTGTSTLSALSLRKHPNSLPQLHRSDQTDEKLFFTIFPLKFNLPPGERQRHINVHYCGQFLSNTLGDKSPCRPRRKTRPWILQESSNLRLCCCLWQVYILQLWNTRLYPISNGIITYFWWTLCIIFSVELISWLSDYPV